MTTTPLSPAELQERRTAQEIAADLREAGKPIYGSMQPVMTSRVLLNEAAAFLELLSAPAAPRERETPAARWREEGKPDPHGDRFDCPRSALPKGDMTDDELANAVFLVDHRNSLESIHYLDAAKNRIRWLSRQLARALAPSTGGGK